MTSTLISKRIHELQAELQKLTGTLCAMDHTDIQTYPENYQMLATDAALRSESISCKLRHILYDAGGIRKEEYLLSAAVVQGVRITDKNGILEITLPSLIPKRKVRQNSEFLIDPLYFTLSQYADNHPLPRYRHCVVCFSHIYQQDLPLRRIRDYDNLQLKKLLDVVSAFIMEDDTGLLVDAYNTTELGEADCTRISVMDKDRFFDWLKARESRLKNTSDFR